MEYNVNRFLNHYRKALLIHQTQKSSVTPDMKRDLRDEASATGLQIIDLTKLHQQIIIKDLIPNYTGELRSNSIRKATQFFIAVMAPVIEFSTSSRESTRLLKQSVRSLVQRNAELAAASLDLEQETAQRQEAEFNLKNTEKRFTNLLKKSNRLQEQLRHLSRKFISEQENERKRISRELHDIIAQALAGINIRLSILQKEAEIGTQELSKNITETQQLVEQSMNIIHRFARDLRPESLDDLGLIPALHDAFQTFTTHTGIHIQLSTDPGIEKLCLARRTALYRLITEALTNIDRHARATQVDVRIHKVGDNIMTTVHDNGQSFNVSQAMQTKAGKHLGLLGMQERIEMLGGRFNLYSAPEQGTTITARIPFGKSKPVAPLTESGIINPVISGNEQNQYAASRWLQHRA